MNYAQEVAPLEWRSAYKVGYWKEVWGADKVFAYPSFMLQLPNTNQCNAFKTSDPDEYRRNSVWGIVYGEVEVTAPISSLVYQSNDGMVNPVGKWTGFFTTEEINWLYLRKAGNFKLKDGWFFKWFGEEKPYRGLVTGLWGLRQSGDPMVGNIACRIGQGLSGKLDQSNKDGTMGSLCNYIYAALTRSRCRLAVADFIHQHAMLDNLIAVQVDGCLFDAPVSVEGGGGLGQWRANEPSPCLVLGKGEIWKPDKKPLGLGFDEVVGAFKANPTKSYYQFGSKYLDLKVMATDVDRQYDDYPRTGGEALGVVADSQPIKVGV